jgi:hypothetical protein
LVIVGPVGLFGLTSGCGGGAPSPVTPSQPVPAPVVTGVTPNIGSTGGGATVTISGTGFLSVHGITVTLDATRATNVETPGSTMFTFLTPAHAPGTVDLVVSNPDGQSHRLVGAYTYVSPESLDLNGQWVASVRDGSHRLIAFTIQDNKLVSASCTHEDKRALPLPSPPPSVSNGEFSFVGSDGVSMSGRIVSPSEVIGTMNFAACTNLSWKTDPRTPQ